MLRQSTELEFAYKYCDQVTQQNSRSFYLATSFLTRAKRRAMRAFYAFCRVTDDIVDQSGEGMPDLKTWRAAAQQPVVRQTHPVLLAWSDTKVRFAVPPQFAQELIDGCTLDLAVHRYANFDQLRRYCYLVASTVGLTAMHIIGAVDGKPFDAQTTATAIELGVALQLTNILRDIGDDLQRGRVYLPQDEMMAYGYSDQDLYAHTNDERFRCLMRFQIERAHNLYAANLAGIAKLQPDGRLAVGVALLLYRGILDKIVANHFNVFSKRAHLTTFDKIMRLPGIYVQVMSL